MKSINQYINESTGVNIHLSDKEAEWVLGCLIDGYESADKNNFWENGALLNKKQAADFFAKLFDIMNKSCDFVKSHGWYRDIEKNMQ